MGRKFLYGPKTSEWPSHKRGDFARCKRMKSISVKRIAAVAAGAAMIGAAFAGAVTPEGLGSYPFFSNGEPQVKIVVGAGAAASDGVAAANIAAMIGNLAYTSRAIEIQGQDQLVCTGGAGSAVCTLGDKSATLEITTPGVNPAVAYEMKTYIADFLNRDSPDQYRNSSGVNAKYLTGSCAAAGAIFPNSAGTSCYYGKKVASTESPLAFNGYIQDNTANKKYQQDERYYFYSNAMYSDADKKVEALANQVAYHVQFVDPIPACTLMDTSGASGTVAMNGWNGCKSSADLTQNHHVKINFLGDQWSIVEMTGVYNTTAGNARVTLGKEIVTNGLMQVGDTVSDPDSNYSVKLISVSPFSTTTAQLRDAQFQAFDGSGNLVGTYRIIEGSSDTIAGPSIVVKVNKLFSGTGGVANADVTLYSSRLELKNGQLDSADNRNWQVSLELANVTGTAAVTSDALKAIKLNRVTVPDLYNAGDSASIVDKPVAMKWTWNGISTVDQDTISVNVRNSPVTLPISGTATQQLNTTLLLSTTRTSGFQFGTTGYTGNQLYNDIVKANYWYQAPDGYWYALSLQGDIWGSNLTYNYGSATVNIDYNNNTVSGWAQLVIPEYVTAENSNGYLGEFVINVYGENGTNPMLLPSSGSTAQVFYAGIANSNGWTNYLNTAFNTTTQFTAYSSYNPGLITPRGSEYRSIASTGANIDYATSLAYATYTLSRSSSSATGNTAEVTKAEGEEYDIGNGYKVKVKTISATATATGEVAGATVSAESLAYLTPNPSSADSVVALNTATNPLVVLDSDPMAAATSKLIVVGGPMVNSVAATVSGSDAISTAGSTPVVKAVGDKILVAGYTAADTKAAADALIAYLASMRESITTG